MPAPAWLADAPVLASVETATPDAPGSEITIAVTISPLSCVEGSALCSPELPATGVDALSSFGVVIVVAVLLIAAGVAVLARRVRRGAAARPGVDA